MPKSYSKNNKDHSAENVDPRAQGPITAQLHLQNTEFQKKFEQHRKELRNLHAKRSQEKNKEKKMRIEDEINNKVIAWNTEHRVEPHYYDLHGMTLNGARKHVAEILDKAEKQRTRQLKFETGLGSHSIKKGPTIKEAVSDMLKNYPKVDARNEQANDGLIIVTFK